MANLIGKKAWGRTKHCKRIGCCNHPYRTKSAQRQLEERTWSKDWDEENAPEYPEWIDKVVGYVEARLQGS